MNSQIVTKSRLDKLRDTRYALREEYYKDALPIIGKTALAELRELYDLYDERLLIWYANLWDPETGGFYYSNSARDTELFLPDVESTMQVLYLFDRTGLAKDKGDRYVNVLPKKMKNSVIRFVQSLQCEDGYFYHPQWGKNINFQRRGRDLGWSRQLLHAYGIKPKYLLPIEKTDAGDKSPYLPSHLQSIDAFREYLSEQDLSRKSYSVGNIIDSQVSQIKAAGQEYVDLLLSWLAEHQRPNTGLWQDELNYYSVNGLYKISMSHPGLGAYVPHADKCIESAMKAVLLDDELTYIFEGVCPWTTIRGLFRGMHQNLGIRKTRESRAMLLEHAPELIKKSREKLLSFRREDGTFSYFVNESADYSQGVPVAVPHSAEGDVNATGAALKSVPMGICAGLGIPTIPIFSPADAQLFFELIENAGPIVKKYKNPYGDELPAPLH